MGSKALVSCLFLLLVGSGCALMDAFSDPVEDPDVGVEDTGSDEPDAEEPDAEEPDAEEPDAEEPLDCDEGDTRACDCSGSPVGTETCDDAGEFGVCECPETCVTEAGDEVVAGGSCGLCGTSEYSCEGDDAVCEELVDYNACGTCEDQAIPGCDEGEELLVCGGDGVPTCEPVAPTLTEMNVTAIDSNLIEEVFYVFVQGVGPSAGCGGEWERGAAAVVPQAYQKATEVGPGNYEVALPAPGASESGVLRVLVRQAIDLAGEADAAVVTTHFGCAGHFLSADSVSVEAVLHPFLFEGEYTYSVRVFSAGESFPASTVPSWIGRTISRALRSPARLFVGCTSDECGSLQQFPGLLAQFDSDRSRPSVPTPSYWSSYYGDWSAFAGDADRREALIEVYEAIADEHYDLINLVEAPFDGTSYRRFLDFQFDANRSFMLYLESFAIAYSAEGVRGGLEETGRGMNVRGLGGLDPWNPIALVGNQPAPHIPPPPGVAFLESSGTLEPGIAPDLTTISMPNRSVDIRGVEQFRYLLFDYFPRTVYPRIIADDDGEFVTYSAEYYEDIVELFRDVFACDEVRDRLVDAIGASDADDFFGLCEDLYGDPDGREVLRQLTELIPFDHASSFNASTTVTDVSCPMSVERSETLGIQFRTTHGVGNPFDVTACTDPDALVFVSFGAAFVTEVGLLLRLERGVPQMPESL